MSAILELKETPQSCYNCELKYYCSDNVAGNEVFLFNYKRHHDCPLKITEDNLRWQKGKAGVDTYFYWCPNCGDDSTETDEKCPSCGIKLLPPEAL